MYPVSASLNTESHFGAQHQDCFGAIHIKLLIRYDTGMC